MSPLPLAMYENINLGEEFYKSPKVSVEYVHCGFSEDNTEYGYIRIYDRGVVQRAIAAGALYKGVDGRNPSVLQSRQAEYEELIDAEKAKAYFLKTRGVPDSYYNLNPYASIVRPLEQRVQWEYSNTIALAPLGLYALPFEGVNIANYEYSVWKFGGSSNATYEGKALISYMVSRVLGAKFKTLCYGKKIVGKYGDEFYDYMQDLVGNIASPKAADALMSWGSDEDIDKSQGDVYLTIPFAFNPGLKTVSQEYLRLREEAIHKHISITDQINITVADRIEYERQGDGRDSISADQLKSYADAQELSIADASPSLGLDSFYSDQMALDSDYLWIDSDIAADLDKDAYFSQSIRGVLNACSNDTIADLIAWDGMDADMSAYAADASYWNFRKQLPSFVDTDAALTNSIRVNLDENPGTSIAGFVRNLDDALAGDFSPTPTDKLAELARRYSGQHQSASNWLEDVYNTAGEYVENLLGVNISNGRLTPEAGYGETEIFGLGVTYQHIEYELPVFQFFLPIALDMDNDGDIELVPLSESTAFFDMDGDGYLENTGWVGPDDGLLVYDMDDDGLITDAKELSFKLWSDEAVTDMDGLRLMFDTNSDGKLDSADDNFALFKIWQDLDQDGEVDAAELASLSSKITSIDLDVEAMDDVAICVKTPEVFSSGVFQ